MLVREATEGHHAVWSWGGELTLVIPVCGGASLVPLVNVAQRIHSLGENLGDYELLLHVAWLELTENLQVGRLLLFLVSDHQLYSFVGASPARNFF